MPKLGVIPHSDDVVCYAFETDEKTRGESFDGGGAQFLVALKDGTEIPIKVDYTVHGWEFEVVFPEGAELKKVEGCNDD